MLTIGGGLLVTMLMFAVAIPSGSTSAAGRQAAVSPEEEVVRSGSPLVVVGTAGLRWEDVSSGRAPTLRSLTAEDAGTAGDSLPTGSASRCTTGGWLALSAGGLAEVTDTRSDDGAWLCPDVTVADGQVSGWDDLVGLQDGSTYQADLGLLGDTLDGAGACTTAIGPGAAIALARADGSVDRYLPLDDARDDGAGALAAALAECPVSVIDAGDVTAVGTQTGAPEDAGAQAGTQADAQADASDTDPAEEQESPTPEEEAAEAAAREATRNAAVLAVDEVVADVIDAVPASTTVLVVDVANVPGTRPALGVTAVRPGVVDPDGARFLTSASTRTDGVVRLLDVPSTVLSAVGAEVPSTIEDTPLTYGSPRPTDAATAADELTDLTALDHVRRGAYIWFVDVPLYAGLALAGLCLALGRWGPWGRSSERLRSRGRRLAEAAALVLTSLSAAAFLVSLTSWWRFDAPGWALAASTVGMTAAVAGLGALAPRRPVWAAPAIVTGLTFVVLTIDGVIGTPLNRASPLGSAPTFGARFYGFGNPTFSVYAVAAVVVAAALAQWLVARQRRRTAALVVAVIGVVAMLVDVGPTYGADLGGGLVLAPTFAVLVLAASGARLTFRRFFVVGTAGVLAVAAVGVLDWLRPPAERSHLGRFVAQVIDGEAWDTLLRKAGYALRSVLGGVPVWLTLVVLVLAALLLFAPRRFTPRWFTRTEDEWPLLRPAVLAIWVMAVAGSFVNDFGVRIAMIALIPAVPVLTMAALRAAATAGTAAQGSASASASADTTAPAESGRAEATPAESEEERDR
ncbi:hypothetical protein GCM10025865_16420 [Paraoerskovia sediminicola]|uniref:Uncharacterized protein n=1 Tax=Paraoerskovia sediminicola TaxID=1138587 RepID=A0ABN6XBJ9_9CELL|nr:hypothetical protein [Paraoerskovia sediminicola]BDZ42343.1 hypothetical protein GCM10025865_16420 [Paraoerskovia sediminicola]